MRSRQIAGVASGLALTMLAVTALAYDTLVHAVLGAVVYRTTERAIEAGFTGTEVCVGTDEGAIGFHYVHHDRVMDGLLDATAPEVLVFLQLGADDPHLVAVQWVFPLGQPSAPIPENPAPAPKILGQPMLGPVTGEGSDLPPHYYLYMWLNEINPDGIFASMNPWVRCPPE